MLVLGLVLCRPASGQVQPSLEAQADSLAAVGDSLRQQRAFSEAQAAYERAAALYREAGEQGAAATRIGDVGALYYLQGEAAAAQESFQRAADLAREAGARGEVASNVNNLGLIEWRRGNYTAALRHFEEAVAVHRTRKDTAQVAAGLNNIGNVLEEQGQFAEALKHLREALQLNRAVQDSASIGSNLNNIALILESQGRYQAAFTRHREALEIHRSLGEREEVAVDLNNIGLVLKEQGRYAEALEHYRESLEINRALERTEGIAINLGNIGSVQRQLGRYEAALESHRQALEMHRSMEAPARIATDFYFIGDVHASRGAFESALEYYHKALRLNRELGRQPSVAGTLYRIGSVYTEQGRTAAADSVLSESVAMREDLIRTASGEARRDFLAGEIHAFQALVTARVRAGDAAGALRAFERGRARLLTERLSESRRATPDDLPSAEALQSTVGPEAAAVLYANTDTRRPLTALVVTQDSIRAREMPDSSLVASTVAEYQEALDRLRLRETVVRTPDQTLSLLEEGKGLTGVGTEGEELTKLVRLYRHDLGVPSGDQVLSDARHRRLGQHLYELLVAPLETELAGAQELIVVPDGALGYLPFETLVDWEGTYLIEERRVRYVQSLRVLRLLQQRETAEGRGSRGLLALGGAVYDDQTYAADTSDLSGAMMAGRTRRADGSWPNLPGSLREVRQLGRIASPTDLLIGAEARERTLQQMDAQGELEPYRALHFATHGLVVPEAPSQSALVLSGASSTAPDTSGLDGYLTMDEIATLSLEAEFVGLSACQTGLGRIYRGSGVVSLAQAFLRAGADATAVSLWSVYDASTQVFMEAVYRRAWRYDQSWAEALASTKRAFLTGHYGERYQDPRFWGPFVHYGRTAR